MASFKKHHTVVGNVLRGHFPPFNPPKHLTCLYDLCQAENIKVPQDFIQNLKNIKLNFFQPQNPYDYSDTSSIVKTVVSFKNIDTTSLVEKLRSDNSDVSYIPIENKTLFKNIGINISKDDNFDLKSLYALNFFCSQRFEDFGIASVANQIYTVVFKYKSLHEIYRDVKGLESSSAKTIDNLSLISELTDLFNTGGLELQTQIFLSCLHSLHASRFTKVNDFYEIVSLLPENLKNPAIEKAKAIVFVKVLEHIYNSSGFDSFPAMRIINSVYPWLEPNRPLSESNNKLSFLQRHITFFLGTESPVSKIFNKEESADFDLHEFWKNANNFSEAKELISKKNKYGLAHHDEQVKAYHLKAEFPHSSLPKKFASLLKLIPNFFSLSIKNKINEKADIELTQAKFDILFSQLDLYQPSNKSAISTQKLINHILAEHLHLFSPAMQKSIITTSQTLINSIFLKKLFSSSFSINPLLVPYLESHALQSLLEIKPQDIAVHPSIEKPQRNTNKI